MLFRRAGARCVLVDILVELPIRNSYIYLRDHTLPIRKMHWTLLYTCIVGLFSVDHVVQMLIFFATLPSRETCPKLRDKAGLRVVGLVGHRARTAVSWHRNIQDVRIAYQMAVRLSLRLVVRVPHR